MLDQVDSEQLPTELATQTMDASQAAVSRQASRARTPTQLPKQLGRYRVVESLGAGAMGRVLLASDTELGREVALKVLHDVSEGRHQQLLAEAQAMARLTHPNVVTVFDVGEEQGQIFIAMQYVRGPTLRRWQRAHAGDWRRILRVYLGAAQGLEAAHRAGLVHRDFKPDNVLVDEAGVAKVTDFGLAELSPAGSESSGPRLPADLEATQAQSGARSGTPAYMAPECIYGLVAGPRADQFAFCVALWEALHGTRPFGGNTIQELFYAITTGQRREPADSSEVPRGVRRVLERGLALDSRDRFASMSELCDALERIVQPFVRRYAWALGTAALGTAIALGALVSAKLDTRACEGAAELIAASWDADRNAQLRGTFEASELIYATDTWERVELRLAGFASEWRSARLAVCEMPEAAAETARATLCLDQQRRRFAAVVEVLGQADTTIVERSVELVAELPEPANCSAEQSTGDWRADSSSLPPSDASSRAALREGRAALVRAQVLVDAGEYEAAQASLDAELERARGLDYAPALAAVQLQLGRLALAESRFADAERSLLEAFFIAEELGDAQLAVRATNQMTLVMAAWTERLGEARTWSTLAAHWVSRLGPEPSLLAAAQLEAEARANLARGQPQLALTGAKEARAMAEALLAPDDPRGIRFLTAEAEMLGHQGLYAESLLLRQAALERVERAFGPAHPRLAASSVGLGMGLAQVDRLDEASAAFERALAVWTEVFGPESPEASRAMLPLGNVAMMRGDAERASEHFERALAIRERAYGPEDRRALRLRNNLAIVHQRGGKLEQAKALYEYSLEVLERSLGPDHPEIGDTLLNLATLQHELGELPASRVSSERALRLSERAHGRDHPGNAVILANLASLAIETGDCADALGRIERAVTIMDAARGESHSRMVTPLHIQARALVCLERYELAIPVLERALEIGDSEHYQDASRSSVLFVLGRAQLGLGRRAKARARMLEARDNLGDSASDRELREHIQAALESL